MFRKYFPSFFPKIIKRVSITASDLEFYGFDDYTHPFNPTMFGNLKGKTRNFDRWIYVMHNNKKVAHIDYSPQTGQLGIIGVQEKYQQHGIMTSLVNHAVNDMKKQYKPEYCWAVTNTDPESGSFKLFMKFKGKYSNPADESIYCAGLRFKIDYNTIYPHLNNIKLMEDMKTNDDYRHYIRFGMAFDDAKAAKSEDYFLFLDGMMESIK
jgi:hypothetical protein